MASLPALGSATTGVDRWFSQVEEQVLLHMWLIGLAHFADLILDILPVHRTVLYEVERQSTPLYIRFWASDGSK
jgi:hypothetical protein